MRDLFCRYFGRSVVSFRQPKQIRGMEKYLKRKPKSMTEPSEKKVKVDTTMVDENIAGAKPCTSNNGSASQLKYSLEQVKGDLFSCPDTSSLAHCISADVAMGKGIAVLFKKKFGGVQDLKSQHKQRGEVAILKRDSRYVYYLITKDKYWQKPTYNDLTLSLRCMKKHCIANGVKNLCMPKIGCGLDGLQWPKVTDIINDEFHDTQIAVKVYYI